jgi:hypothetical protein
MVLQEAYCDSSSVIYLQKIGCWNILSQTITLYTIPVVLTELGYKPVRIRVDAVENIEDRNTATTDDALVAAAVRRKLALVSEDKYILKKAQQYHLPFYNTLMMLNFLLYKRVISSEKYTAFCEVLHSFAWYSPPIWEYSRQLYLEICNICTEQPQKKRNGDD